MKEMKLKERNDYVRATEALRKKAAAAARKVHYKMVELDEEELDLSTGVLCAYERKSNVGSEKFLSWSQDYGQGGGDLMDSRVSSVGEKSGHYLHGDFNYWITYATSEEFLRFVNSFPEIREKLEEIEKLKTEECEEALRKSGLL